MYFPLVDGGGFFWMASNIISLSFDVLIFCILLWYTSSAVSSDLWIRCLLSAETNKIGKSVNGAILLKISSSEDLVEWVSFSMVSHLFTNRTTPFLFFSITEKMLKSCFCKPSFASIINRQTSQSSIALMALITE